MFHQCSPKYLSLYFPSIAKATLSKMKLVLSSKLMTIKIKLALIISHPLTWEKLWMRANFGFLQKNVNLSWNSWTQCPPAKWASSHLWNYLIMSFCMLTALKEQSIIPYYSTLYLKVCSSNNKKFNRGMPKSSKN